MEHIPTEPVLENHAIQDNESQNNNKDNNRHNGELDTGMDGLDVRPAERHNKHRTENSEDEDEEEDGKLVDNGDITERVRSRDISERDRTRTPNGYHHGDMGREGARGRPTYVHSYGSSRTKSWLGWSSRVVATSNIELVLRNISFLHFGCSLLLVVMGVTGIVAKSYMSFLATAIWSSVFFFLPTSIMGLCTYRRMRNYCLIRNLTIMSILSMLLSLSLGIAHVVFLIRDDQHVIDCVPSPTVTTELCRATIYRVLINVVLVFLFVMELLASIFSLAVCCLVRPGCTKQLSSETEQLISNTSMSYKRLGADETVDFLEELSEVTTDDHSSGDSVRYSRSISAPTLLGDR